MAIVSAVVIYNNGTEVNLTQGEGNIWSATFPAPSQTSGSNNSGQGPGVGSEAAGKGYYPVSVKVTDDAGNVTEVDSDDPTWGIVLRLKVLETTAPTAQITYPTQGALISNAQPVITFSLSDSGSGINPSTVYIKIDDGNAVQVSPEVSGATATGSYTPSTALGEGQHTVVVYGSDYDGNQSSQVSVTFTVDTVPPTLNVTSPTDNLRTNQSQITVSGTTNDVTSSPVTVKVTVGQTEYNPTVGSDGAFSQQVTLAEGENTITIVATDAANKSTTVTRHVYLDTQGPQITNITLAPNPADNGETVTIQVTITDA